MAHPKLASVVGRSVLTAATAALMVGPLAGAGIAAESLLDPAKDLTCDEAKATEIADLIEEFCDEPDASATESPLDKSVDEVTDTVDKTVDDVTDEAPTVDDGDDGDGGGSGGGGSTPDPGEVIDDTTDGGDKVEKTDGGNGFTEVDGGSGSGSNDSGSGGGSRDGSRDRAGAGSGSSASYGYNADGPFRPGMRSNSSLTLQPFAAPLVSVPPVYELPQIASQLFGSDAAVGAENPQIAGATTATSASGYSPTGYTATSADPTGWLAATATGLIMLVGAAHAINGGRTPKRQGA